MIRLLKFLRQATCWHKWEDVLYWRGTVHQYAAQSCVKCGKKRDVKL